MLPRSTRALWSQSIRGSYLRRRASFDPQLCCLHDHGRTISTCRSFSNTRHLRYRTGYTSSGNFTEYARGLVEEANPDGSPNPVKVGKGFVADVKISFAEALDGEVQRFRVMVDIYVSARSCMYKGHSPALLERIWDPRAHPGPVYRFPYPDRRSLADALYILGRVELERDPKYRRSAWYLLEGAVHCGSRDAALLLHRLARHDRSLPLTTHTQTCIKRSMDDGSSDRAVIAVAEREVWDRPVVQRRPDRVEHILHHLLMHLDSTDNPVHWKILQNVRYDPAAVSFEDGSLDTDALEVFPNVAHCYWTIFESEQQRLLPWLKRESRDQKTLLNAYVKCLREDAERYRNHRAIYECTRLPAELQLHEPGSEAWIRSLKEAGATVPEASFIYARDLVSLSKLYHVTTEDHKISPLSRKSEADLKPTQAEALVTLAECIGLLVHEGKIGSAAWLCVAVAGIYSANGMHDRGRAFLVDSLPAIEKAVGQSKFPSDYDKIMELLRGLIRLWDTYRAEGLYNGVRPEDAFDHVDKALLSKGSISLDPI